MLLSHYYMVSIASHALAEPFGVASLLCERALRRQASACALLSGLDDLPPSVTMADARELPKAVLAVLLAYRSHAARLPFTWNGVYRLPEGDGIDPELQALAQHIAFAPLVPYRVSVCMTRSLTSLYFIARTPDARLGIFSATGAPVLVVEARGGVAIAGYSATLARIQPAQDPAPAFPGNPRASLLQAAG